ncbi:MAG TPA: hypothetical protein VF148_08895 [Acidimicrobiia bacterium]
MRRLQLLLSTAAFVVVASPAQASEEVTVSQLVAESVELSGVVVIVEGELVGDYGFRDDGSMWTQLNGDTYALVPLLQSERPAGGNVGVGIRVPAELAEDLDPPGGYRNRGPLVRVTGTWVHHSDDRQGESFLRVESLEVLEPGIPLHQSANVWTMAVGLVLILAATMVWLTRPQE